jgi:hypothetical protein
MLHRFVVSRCVLFLLGSILSAFGFARAANYDDSEAAYTRDINKRADKIIAVLGISDDSLKSRVHDLIVQQYRSLREIHDGRDSKIAEVKQGKAADRTVADAWIKVARDSANLKLVDAHRRFLAHLSVELTPEQVNKIKDGLTYNVAPITYKRYVEVLPALKEEQKREILADLLEARECAMDAGSAKEKHDIFDKYKGRINNYLSAAGYDLKQAEKDLAARQKVPSQSR